MDVVVVSDGVCDTLNSGLACELAPKGGYPETHEEAQPTPTAVLYLLGVHQL